MPTLFYFIVFYIIFNAKSLYVKPIVSNNIIFQLHLEYFERMYMSDDVFLSVEWEYKRNG